MGRCLLTTNPRRGSPAYEPAALSKAFQRSHQGQMRQVKYRSLGSSVGKHDQQRAPAVGEAGSRGASQLAVSPLRQGAPTVSNGPAPRGPDCDVGSWCGARSQAIPRPSGRY